MDAIFALLTSEAALSVYGLVLAFLLAFLVQRGKAKEAIVIAATDAVLSVLTEIAPKTKTTVDDKVVVVLKALRQNLAIKLTPALEALVAERVREKSEGAE